MAPNSREEVNGSARVIQDHLNSRQQTLNDLFHSIDYLRNACNYALKWVVVRDSDMNSMVNHLDPQGRALVSKHIPPRQSKYPCSTVQQFCDRAEWEMCQEINRLTGRQQADRQWLIDGGYEVEEIGGQFRVSYQGNPLLLPEVTTPNVPTAPISPTQAEHIGSTEAPNESNIQLIPGLAFDVETHIIPPPRDPGLLNERSGLPVTSPGGVDLSSTHKSTSTEGVRHRVLSSKPPKKTTSKGASSSHKSTTSKSKTFEKVGSRDEADELAEGDIGNSSHSWAQWLLTAPSVAGVFFTPLWHMITSSPQPRIPYTEKLRLESNGAAIYAQEINGTWYTDIRSQEPYPISGGNNSVELIREGVNDTILTLHEIIEDDSNSTMSAAALGGANSRRNTPRMWGGRSCGTINMALLL